MTNLADLEQLSIDELTASLASGELTSTQVTNYAIRQHDSFAILNAYKSWNADMALESAAHCDQLFTKGTIHSPLQGIPVSVKDLYGVQGYPIYAGTPKPLPEFWNQEGSLIHSLKKSYCVFTGKTHTVEFAFGGLGTNCHWGTPKNPWDNTVDRVPGGSSSGAAVSLCQGSVWLALGTDTAGSVRVPAAFTGNVGLKTGKGRWSTQGIVPLSPTLDTAGILTRTVQDAITAFGVLDPHHKSVESVRSQFGRRDKQRIRFGTSDGVLWNNSESSIADACLQAMREMDQSRFELVAVDFPEAEHAIELRNQGGVTSVEFAEFIQSELPDWQQTLDRDIRNRLTVGSDLSAVEYLKRLRKCQQLADSALSVFDTCDVIASPTVPISPPALDEVKDPDQYQKINLTALQNTCIANFISMCAISIPIGLDSLELPVGLQLMAPLDNEEFLLEIAESIQQVVPPPKLNLTR